MYKSILYSCVCCFIAICTCAKGYCHSSDVKVHNVTGIEVRFDAKGMGLTIPSQGRSVSGKVTDEKGVPIIGANIMVKGTTTGTITDIDGSYTIELPEEARVLVFTYIGYKSKEIEIKGKTEINVTMYENTAELNEIVVTALGVKKEKVALGYASTKVESALIEDRTEGDIARVLSGKVAGLVVTNSSGLSGSGTNVIIRGFTSFTGSNQALFVVDGVPYNNDVTQASGGFYNNVQSTNRAFDIDPNDIEKVEVLKGLAATTLYGADGTNGVILITTKSGSSNYTKPSITVTQSFFINQYANKPDYQTQYGQGDNGVFNPTSLDSWGPSYNKDGLLGWGNDPNIDENGAFRHYYADLEYFPEFENARLNYQPNRALEQFLEPGYVSNTSFNANAISKDGDTKYSFGFGYLDDDSFLPGNYVNRMNISFGGKTKIQDRLTISSSIRYTQTDANTPRFSFEFSGAQGRGGLFPYVLIMPRNVDWATFPYMNPIDNSNEFFVQDFNHPSWLAENLSYNQKTNRLFWNVELDFEFVKKHLSLKWRTGQDWYNTRDFNTINRGGEIWQFFGELESNERISNSWNHLLALNGNFDIIDDLHFDFNIGGNTQSNRNNATFFELQNQIIFGEFNFANFSDVDNKLYQSSSLFNQVGIFGQAVLDYKDYIFLNISARGDWVSNLQPGFNNALYPSISLSFIPTRVFSNLKSQKGLNYLKLRASLGNSTRFARGYPIDAGISQSYDAIRDLNIQRLNGDVDEKIVPESVTEWELGFESRFLKYRGSIDFSVFKRVTENILSTITAPPSTGNLGRIQTNTGRAEAAGIEMDLGFDLIQKKDFIWNARLNFFSHRETLIRRDNPFGRVGSQPFLIFGFDRIGRNAAIVGESLGAIVGTRIRRNEDGIPIISDDGDFLAETRDENGNLFLLGDAIPDYRMNLYNSLEYKSWTFSWMIHHTKGGDFFTQMPAILQGRGLTTDNLSDHGNFIVIEGVTEEGLPNRVPISPERYWKTNIAFGPTELKMYDGSLIRLQEITFGYQLPKKFTERLPFNSISILATGYNLWFRAYNIPKGLKVDTNTIGPGPGNNRGIDYTGSIGSRRYGVSIKASF